MGCGIVAGMIGYLKGVVIDVGNGEIILEVGGVGYLVKVSGGMVVKRLAPAEMFVYTHVREDEISLYGFESKKALGLFKLLIGVNGVGPKVGMAIIGADKPDRILDAVSRADVEFFTAVPGIGKKGAQKIIIELKNKVGTVEELDLVDGEGDDVVDALVGMGYERRSVVEVLQQVEDGLDESEKIKRALKLLMRS